MMLDLGTVSRTMPGECACGDAFLIDRMDHSLLVGVVDGLGHGEQAAEAAHAFTESVGQRPRASLESLMLAAHADIAGTRGAAAALLRINTPRGMIEFTGVGNIHLHAISDVPIRPICVPGIVGHRLRKVRPFEFPLPSACLLAMCSDGIETRFELADYAELPSQEIADAILAEHGKNHDDATCVIIRFSQV